jgi:tRNA dimethylallyltransferase
MWLATETPCTILSADSRQVYRGFDVGTAKPGHDERRRVPHRGIDVADPSERYSAARWANAASEWIDESVSGGRVPLVVGGTGLYLHALFRGLFDEPELDVERRRGLELFLATLPRAELQRWVAHLDPSRAHLGRTQLLRAVEVALLTGHRLSALHRLRERRPRWRARYLLVDPGPALADRIVERIDSMFLAGWENEVRALSASIPHDAPAWKATGYRHVRARLDGRISPQAAYERIVMDTRQYAKRQRTWFRHQLPAEHVTRVDPLSPNCREVIGRWFRQHLAESPPSLR